MAKKEKDKQKNNSTQLRKLKTKQPEPHQKLGVVSGVPEGETDPAPHVAPVVFLVLLQTQ